jgi:aromatic-L-amino-acid decarboxylase
MVRFMMLIYMYTYIGYMGYVPGGGLTICAVADFISNTLNKYTGFVSGSPGCVDIERMVVNWIASLFYEIECCGTDYDIPYGILTSGGTSAHHSAIAIVINERGLEDIQKYVIYMSEETHFCIRKVTKLCGITKKQLRSIPVNSNFQINIEALESQITSDKEQGLIPLMIVGNVGTVSTGSIDDFSALSRVAKSNNIWLHVDACFGGFYILDPKVRTQMDGIKHADSIVVDPHKGLFLSYGTGCLLVKDIAVLKRTFGTSHEASYINELASNITHHDLLYYDLADMTPEQTRPFRALRIWLSFQLLGTEIFKNTIQERIDLAKYCSDLVRAVDGVQIISEPVLSCFNFRVIGELTNEKEIERMNIKLLQFINNQNRVMLSSTRLNGVFTIRVIVSSFRTDKETVHWMVEDLKKGVDTLFNTLTSSTN